MIDPAQKIRNAAPTYDKTSLFCRLDKPELQNYRIDKALEDFHTIEDLMKLTNCTRARINSHIRYIEKNCYDRVRRELSGEEFRFVLKDASSDASGSLAITQASSNGEIPTKELIEIVLRKIAPKGKEIDEGALKSAVEFYFASGKRKLKPDWWETTKRNLVEWSKKG